VAIAQRTVASGHRSALQVYPKHVRQDPVSCSQCTVASGHRSALQSWPKHVRQDPPVTALLIGLETDERDSFAVGNALDE
jgi:hypothetical protein